MAYHHGNLRQALIDAAVALVDDEGPEHISVREVARRAGVSSGAPFRHFADKEALMSAVAEDGVNKMLGMMQQAYASADTPLEQFRCMGVAFVRFAVENPGHFRVMYKPEYSKRSEAMSLFDHGARGMMRSLIEAAQTSGAMRGGDPELIIVSAFAIVYGLSRMAVDGLLEAEGIDSDQAIAMADAVTNMLGRGFILDAEDG